MKNEVKKTLILFLILIVSVFSIVAQSITPDKKIVYKQIDGDSLYFDVFEPQLSKKPSAVIVFFFGGGWAGGTPKQFYQQSEYFASRGMLAIAAEYRTKRTHGTSPFDCVEDAKSAIRWIRAHHKELNIDPDKIVAAGGSAGGHIALCTALIKGLEHVNEDTLISSVPNTIVAYNPVLDTTEKGYGHEKVIGREKEISPCHQVKSELPPMLLFHGKKDTTVPFENATRFTRLMKEAGNECELVAVDNAGHGFFNGKFFRKNARIKHYDLTIHETDIFLEKLGYLKSEPIISQNTKQVSSVADSNTKSAYHTASDIEVIEKKETTKPRLKIYYIRHAEGGHNVKREWDIFPKNEWPSYVGNHEAFTPKGLMQQSRVSKKLNRFHFDFVAVSPAWRCKNTVLPYLIDSKMKGEIWPELKEIYATNLIISPDLPAYTSSEKILGAGDLINLLPEEAPYLTLRKDGLNEFKKPPFPKDHSESEKENAAAKVVLKKVLNLIDDCAKESYKTILLSGHGSSGKAILRMLTKNPLYHFPQITNAGVWMVEQQDDGTFKLKMFNDVPFLE